MSERSDQLREQILSLVREYHAEAFPSLPFEPGVSGVPVSGKVFGAEELEHVVSAGLDFWLTTGRFAAQFERELEVSFQQFGLLRWGEWAAQSVDAAFADSRSIVREKHFAQGDVPVSGERVREPRVNPEGGNDVFGEPLVKRGEGGPVARVKSGDHLAPHGITDAAQLGFRVRETMEMVVCVVH